MEGGDPNKKKKFSFERKNFIIVIMVCIIIVMIVLAFALKSGDDFRTRRIDSYGNYSLY